MMRSTWICLATLIMCCFGVTATRTLAATETTIQREALIDELLLRPAFAAQKPAHPTKAYFF